MYSTENAFESEDVVSLWGAVGILRRGLAVFFLQEDAFFVPGEKIVLKNGVTTVGLQIWVKALAAEKSLRNRSARVKNGGCRSEIVRAGNGSVFGKIRLDVI